MKLSKQLSEILLKTEWNSHEILIKIAWSSPKNYVKFFKDWVKIS